jgi:hypothetical protein
MSALFFGSCIDEALNVFLLQKKKNLTEEEKELIKEDPFRVFDKYFSEQVINNETVYVPTSERVDYFKSDYTPEFLTKEDIEQIDNHPIKELESVDMFNYEEFIQECFAHEKRKNMLDIPELRLKNFITWLSLRRKGHEMIKAYNEQVFPLIEEVIAVQTSVELSDSRGNIIRGKIDVEAKFYGDKVRVWDHKTSSKLYKEDDANNAPQLTIYSEDHQNPYVGYIVMLKKPYKKRPILRTQVVKGEITEEQYERTFQTVENVLESINNEEFSMNKASCFSYGRPCEYYNLCHKDSMEGLIKLKERK